MAAAQRFCLVSLVAALLVGCGGSATRSTRVSTPASLFPTSASGSGSAASPGATASPSGPVTPTPDENAGQFWSRRGVVPSPPPGFLDNNAALPLPAAGGSVPAARRYVQAALRELSGETYAVDHLRLDIVESGVLGPPGLSGDDRSVIQARNAGLTATTTSLTAVQAASVVALSAADARGLDAYVVVLRLAYGPFVGTYAGGASRTLPPTPPQTQALIGHLVANRLLGTYLYVTRAVDCASAAKGSVTAKACATLR